MNLVKYRNEIVKELINNGAVSLTQLAREVGRTMAKQHIAFDRLLFSETIEALFKENKLEMINDKYKFKR